MSARSAGRSGRLRTSSGSSYSASRVGESAAPRASAFWARSLVRKRTSPTARSGWRLRRDTPRCAPPVEPAPRGPRASRGSGAIPTRPRTLESRAWNRSIAYGQFRRKIAWPSPKARRDEPAEERERLGGPLGLGEHRAVGREQPRPVRPERFENVHHEPLVLLRLPQVAVERGVALALPDPAHLPHERFEGLRRLEPVLPEEVRAVVEEPDVHDPGQREDAAVVRRRLDRAREVRPELARAETRREVEQPAGARELGHPDEVEHHHVEAGAPPLEVDDVELVLLV